MWRLFFLLPPAVVENCRQGSVGGFPSALKWFRRKMDSAAWNSGNWLAYSNCWVHETNLSGGIFFFTAVRFGKHENTLRTSFPALQYSLIIQCTISTFWGIKWMDLKNTAQFICSVLFLVIHSNQASADGRYPMMATVTVTQRYWLCMMEPVRSAASTLKSSAPWG